MKQYILVLITFIFFYCSNHQNGDKINADNSLFTSAKDDIRPVGFLVLDLLKLKENNGSVSFYSQTQEYIRIESESIKVGNVICNYLERQCESLIKIGSINLEYDLFVIPCIKKSNDSLYVLVNGIALAVSSRNPYVNFESYISHLKDRLVVIDATACLKNSPTEDADCINNADRYQYKVIEFKNNWVKLIVDEVQFDTSFTGWTKWIEKDSLLIKPIYVF